MTDNGIVWEEPPGPRRNGFESGVWCRLLAPLTERPNAWARVRKTATPAQAHSMVANLRRRLVQVPPGRWEFVARAGYVYARYFGPEEKA